LRGSRNEWARLEDEMEFVEAYLAVEQARFGDRLQTKIDWDSSLGSIEVPTMMIQTLVENAVKHGISNVRRGARIEVAIVPHGEKLAIHVRDNGPGIDLQKLSQPVGDRSGFGLHNIRERLNGHYRGEAELQIGRDESSGMTDVSIWIPLQRKSTRDVETA